MAEEKILQGLPVSGGVITGKVRVIKNVRSIDEVQYGEILVVPKSHPNYAVGMMKASGLICEEGGRLAHLCIVALEMGIPCMTQAKNAMQSLETGKMITLDANEGAVYAWKQN
jgi:phosphoenolpyruvate synthase/pyruvate phosphate dikinase